MAVQQQSRKEKDQLPGNFQDFDDSTVNFESHPICTDKADDVELQTIAEFVIARSKDAFGDQMKQLVGASNCLFTFDNYGNLLIRTALDGFIQNLVPTTLRLTILYFVYPYTLACHPAKLRMYDSLCPEYYWPKIPLTFIILVNSARNVLEWEQNSVINAKLSYFHQVVA